MPGKINPFRTGPKPEPEPGSELERAAAAVPFGKVNPFRLELEPETEPASDHQAEQFARQFALLDTGRVGEIPTPVAVSFFQSSPTVPRIGHRDLNRLWGAACSSGRGTVSQGEFVAMAGLMLRHSAPSADKLQRHHRAEITPETEAAAVRAAGGGESGVPAAAAIAFFRRSKLPAARLNQLWGAAGATADPAEQVRPARQ